MKVYYDFFFQIAFLKVQLCYFLAFSAGLDRLANFWFSVRFGLLTENYFWFSVNRHPAVVGSKCSDHNRQQFYKMIEGFRVFSRKQSEIVLFPLSYLSRISLKKYQKIALFG